MKLEKEKASLERNLGDAGEKEAEFIELSEKTFKFACYARAKFNEGRPENQTGHPVVPRFELFDHG